MAQSQNGWFGYCNKNIGVDIKYPASWPRNEQQTPGFPGYRILFQSPDNNAQVIVNVALGNVGNMPASPDKNAGGAVNSYQNTLNGFQLLHAGPGPPIPSPVSTELYGYTPTYDLAYTYNDDVQGPLTTWEVLASSNTPYNAYSLAFTAPTEYFDTYLPLFQKIYSSFRIPVLCGF
jgi:hypothetical protein